MESKRGVLYLRSDMKWRGLVDAIDRIDIAVFITQDELEDVG